MSIFKFGERKSKSVLTSEIFQFEGEWVLLSEDGQVVLAHSKELKDIIDEAKTYGKKGSFLKVPPAKAILVPRTHAV